MAACDDLIFFDDSGDWQIAASTNKSAELTKDGNVIPMTPIDLGVSIKTDYLAVVASTTELKNTWRYAGEIRQVYNFAGGSGSLLSNAHSPPFPLYINKLQIVKMNVLSPDNFGLVYHPPSWFYDCGIRVYKYVGDTYNFVEDTLFEIGNKLNEGLPSDNQAVLVAIADIKAELVACCDFFETEIHDIKVGLKTDFDEVFRQLAAIRGGQGTGGTRTPSQNIALSYFTNLL
jgi:hypothetical protein